MNALRSHRGIGDGMSARGNDTEHGKPRRCRCVIGNEDSREGQARPCGVAERPVVATKPGNAGGAKGPQFKERHDGEHRRDREIGMSLPHSAKGREATEGVARESEGIAQPPFLCTVRQGVSPRRAVGRLPTLPDQRRRTGQWTARPSRTSRRTA